jgi:hypothetical protein
MRPDGPQRGVRAHERHVGATRELASDRDGELGKIDVAHRLEDPDAPARGGHGRGRRELDRGAAGEHQRGDAAAARQAERHVQAVGARRRRAGRGQERDRAGLDPLELVEVLDQRHPLDLAIGSRARHDAQTRGERG